MIVRERFAPHRVVPYVRVDRGVGAASGLAAWVLVDVAGADWLALPTVLATVLGVALSILLGFRANAAYQRWWDAAGIFAQAGGGCRTFARSVVALCEGKRAAGVDAAAVDAWEREAVLRQIAWLHALRGEARGRDERERLAQYLPEAERARVRAADSATTQLLGLQSEGIVRAYGQGVLVGLDSFQLDQALAGLAQQQALAERLAQIPIPRQYAVFARFFTLLYAVVFPFTIVGSLPVHAWLAVPAALVVALVFGLVERTAWVNETPFAGRITDVPLDAVCTVVERDLLELLREPVRPPRPAPVDGCLW
ncbi:MAG: bestrophin family ion channel [Thermoleophilia bacterium]